MANFSDCEKYKMFVEDNFMMEFIIWEQTILPNDREFIKRKNENGLDLPKLGDVDFDIVD